MLRNVRNQINNISSLAANELLTPQIDLCSNKEVFIDGCCGIIEYTSELVRINCKDIILKVEGKELTIKADSINQICIFGDIISLDFVGV